MLRCGAVLGNRVWWVGANAGRSASGIRVFVRGEHALISRKVMRHD